MSSADLFAKALAAYAKLPGDHQARLVSNWFDLIRTAERLRTDDGIRDGTIPLALREHGLAEKATVVVDPNRHLLMQFYLWGREADKRRPS